jgi:hypothetical protein
MQDQTGLVKTDLTTTDGIHQLVAWVQTRLGRRLQAFQVVVDDQGLVLLGKTQTYYAKQLVQNEVMAATDLPILANHIEVG